jgi:outer membrane receptor protein involved in Fe transport
MRKGAALATGAIAALCTAASSGQEAPTISEMVVTATKREASIQDVPMSVQALGETVLAERGIADMATLAASVPGLSLGDGGPGYRTLYIRGVTTEYGSAGTTGVYIDDSFVQPGGIVQTIVEPMYFDLERIEVLRGPQGTLFGGSSMGGTVRFITRKPDLKHFAAATGAEASTTEHGGFNYEVDGLLNVPIVTDRVALRMVGAYRDKDGYTDKQIGDFSDPERAGADSAQRVENVNGERFTAARIQLTAMATDRFEIRPSLLYQRTYSPSFGAFDRPPSDDQRRGIEVAEPIEDELSLANLTLSYRWDDMQLMSSTSYSERDAWYEEDASDAVEEVVLPVFFGLPRGLFFATTYDGDRTEKTWQEELRLSSAPDNALQWVAGLYYDEYDQDNGFHWFVPGFSDVAFPVANDNFYQSESWLERKHQAAFAEITLPFAKRFTATFGLRWYRFESSTQSFNRDGEFNGGPQPDGPVLLSEEDGFTPRVSLAFDTGDQLLYATASKGFRPGAPNPRVPGVDTGSTCVQEFRDAGIEVSDQGDVEPYESDELWNYEVGARTSWAGGRFVANMAVYRMHWDDVQSLFIAPCFFAATVNFGQARLTGVELDYDLAVTSQFELSGGVNYNESIISEDVPTLGVSKGDQMPSAPKWSGNVNGRFAFPLLGGDGYALLTVRYVGESFRTFDHSDPRTFQESYTLIGGRLGLDRDTWHVSLFGENLGDDDPAVFHFLSSFFAPTSYVRMFPLRGRTFGVTVRKDF